MMPTFRYDKLTATSHRVSDAHTGEAYGVVVRDPWGKYVTPGSSVLYSSRDTAATALYRARYARGFEAGAL